MIKLPISKTTLPDKYWLFYTNDSGEEKYADLTGCAGNFARVTGYVSTDGLQAVGWRYEEQGQLCYELFNVGHLVLFAPLKPSPFQILKYLLSGKKPDAAHRDFLFSFETALNRGGWKTVEREDAQS